MWNDFLTVAGSVATLFLMMAVGFIFAKRGMLGGEALSQMSKLLLTVVAPCIVISTLQVDFSPELLRSMALALGVTIAVYVIYGAMVLLLFRGQREETRACLRFGVMFGNIGFMGLPLITSVLGEEAVIYCALSLIVFNAGNWTYGVFLMGEKMSVKGALLNPGVVGGAISLALFLLRVRLPGPILSAVEYMGSLNTPLAMVVIGGQMASADLLATFKERRLYGATVWKLVVIPVITALVLLPLRLDPVLYQTVVILSGCPAAGATSMFAQMFHKDTASSAQFVTLSTLLSIATLPLAALLAKSLT